MYLHFFSYHSSKIKLSVAIGLFIRALRICHPCYLDQEIRFIFNSLQKLGYPNYFLDRALSSAKRTFFSPKNSVESEKEKSNNLVIPYHKDFECQKSIFKKIGVSLSFKFPNKISNQLVKNRDSIEKNGVYAVPCNSCNLSYIGETAQGLDKRFKQHIYDVKNCHSKLSSGPAQHYINKGHKLNFDSGKLIYRSNNWQVRRFVESSFINNFQNLNLNCGLDPVNKCISQLVCKNVRSPSFLVPIVR